MGCREKACDRDALLPLDAIWKGDDNNQKFWLKCWGHGLWRYFDPATDDWGTQDSSAVIELHNILEVPSSPKLRAVLFSLC